MGDPARSTARRHDVETSGAKIDSTGTSTSLGGEGKVVPKREYPVLESSSAGKGLDGFRQ